MQKAQNVSGMATSTAGCTQAVVLWPDASMWLSARSKNHCWPVDTKLLWEMLVEKYLKPSAQINTSTDDVVRWAIGQWVHRCGCVLCQHKHCWLCKALTGWHSSPLTRLNQASNSLPLPGNKLLPNGISSWDKGINRHIMFPLSTQNICWNSEGFAVPACCGHGLCFVPSVLSWMRSAASESSCEGTDLLRNLKTAFKRFLLPCSSTAWFLFLT